jgi:hypothetical protein
VDACRLELQCSVQNVNNHRLTADGLQNFRHPGLHAGSCTGSKDYDMKGFVHSVQWLGSMAGFNGRVQWLGWPTIIPVTTCTLYANKRAKSGLCGALTLPSTVSASIF